MAREKKLKVVEREAIDPTLPFVEIEIEGSTYKMCMTYSAMARAQRTLRERDSRVVDLMHELNWVTVENAAPLFAASLNHFHPELTLAEVEGMVDIDTYAIVTRKITEAVVLALPKRFLQRVKESQAAAGERETESVSAQ